jgi:starch-binding outer membrane protein, SusD/RagB family
MKRIILSVILTGILGLSITSCSDMMDTNSELVMFQEDNLLNSPVDSVYSVMGIIYKMQAIADRTVLIGEMRGDLMTTTSKASTDLKTLANFTATADNKYNEVSDYYAVINNCNYYLAYVDTSLTKRNIKVFQNEYAAVKAFRAWTYLQLVLAYGNVPLVTDPVLTENKATEEMNKSKSSITDICNYFIDDLKPYINVNLPSYGNIGSQSSSKFFIPMRALLGDLCLWAGRYQEATQYYHDYLTITNNEITTGIYAAEWSMSKDFKSVSNSYSSSVSSVTSNECLSYIPMETSEFNGITSDLKNIYNSTLDNDYYCQAQPSEALKDLSKEQINCLVYTSGTTRDTLYAPTKNDNDELLEGDLRLYVNWKTNVVNQSNSSKYSSDRQTINKISSNGITTYRRNVVYLHYAEALNRAGYPQAAFGVLKYGLYSDNLTTYVDSIERTKGSSLLSFSQYVFTEDNTQGVHSRGCGDSRANAYYVMPMPSDSLASYQDTVDYQIPLVEDMIANEMALETEFEGYRFFDLMRIALRRNDNTYLATPISKRSGTKDETLYNLLLNKGNWYLPLK